MTTTSIVLIVAAVVVGLIVLALVGIVAYLGYRLVAKLFGWDQDYYYDDYGY